MANTRLQPWQIEEFRKCSPKERVEVPTEEENQKMAAEFQATNNPAILEKIIMRNFPFISKLARKKIKPGWSMGDLIQEGALAVSQAAKYFSPDRGCKFSTFMGRCFDNGVTKWREDNSAAVHIPQYYEGLCRFIVKLRRELGRLPTVEEVQEAIKEKCKGKCGLGRETIEKALKGPARTIYTSDFVPDWTERRGQKSSYELRRLPESPVVAKEELLELKKNLLRFIRVLTKLKISAKSREWFLAHHLEDISQNQIAKSCNRTRQNVCSALQRIWEKLNKAGYTEEWLDQTRNAIKTLSSYIEEE